MSAFCFVLTIHLWVCRRRRPLLIFFLMFPHLLAQDILLLYSVSFFLYLFYQSYLPFGFQEMNRVSVPGSPRSHYSPRLLNGHAEPLQERHQRLVSMSGCDRMATDLLSVQVFRSGSFGYGIANGSSASTKDLPNWSSTTDGELQLGSRSAGG